MKNNHGFLSELTNAYLHAWKGSFNFVGKTNRNDFWYFLFIDILITGCLYFLVKDIPLLLPAYSIYFFIAVLPKIAILIRRGRDIGFGGETIVFVGVPILIAKLLWLKVAIIILVLATLTLPSHNEKEKQLKTQSNFRLVYNLGSWLYIVIFILSVASTIFITDEPSNNLKRLSYNELIQEIESRNVELISIKKEGSSIVTLKNGEKVAVTLENNKNLLNILLAYQVDIVRQLGDSNSCELSPPKSSQKNKISYVSMIREIQSGNAISADLYCERYAILVSYDENVGSKKIFFSDIPQLSGLIEDLTERLEKNNITYNQYSTK